MMSEFNTIHLGLLLESINGVYLGSTVIRKVLGAFLRFSISGLIILSLNSWLSMVSCSPFHAFAFVKGIVEEKIT